MNKQYIVINLNKAESAETLQARVKERVRWGILEPPEVPKNLETIHVVVFGVFVFHVFNC